MSNLKYGHALAFIIILTGLIFTILFYWVWKIVNEEPVNCEWEEETPGDQTKCFYTMDVEGYGTCLWWEYIKYNDGSGGGLVGCETP